MKFGKVIRKAVAACPYVPFDNTHVNFREEWQDYWMDYKSFKAIIADISKEKKEKEEALKVQQETEKEPEKEKDIDISMYISFLLMSASLDKEKLFFKELSESVIMVDTFFCKIQYMYVIEVKQLIEEVEKVDSVCSLNIL